MRMRINMEQGGYKQPSNPAPVGLPGALSQRTDGGAVEGMTQPAQTYTGMPYKQNGLINEQQTIEPLAGTPYGNTPTPVSFSEPTQYPDEALSYGADYGDGPGLNTSNINGFVPPSIENVVYRAMQYDTTGEFEAIYNKLKQI